MLRAGETASPREEQTNYWLFNTKWSALKTYMQVTIYRPSRLVYIFRNSYVHTYTYMYTTMTNTKKKAMNLKESKEGYMGGFGGGNGK